MRPRRFILKCCKRVIGFSSQLYGIRPARSSLSATASGRRAFWLRKWVPGWHAGTSAARQGANFDRHWRNARTIASHNPRIYHDRIVGDFAVNGTIPGPQAGVGVAREEEAERTDA